MSFSEVALKILLATLFGGIIGMERERKNRPAGFRTHILVCLASALVMMISEELFLKYEGRMSIDPTRLGAQVISGIGFLGAGTIIRQGASVKGLTTAATLWATSCVGLSVGAGFYEGAAFGGAVIFVVLFILGYIEKHYGSKTYNFTVSLQQEDYFITLEEVAKKLSSIKVDIKTIEFLADIDEDDGNIQIRCHIKMPKVLKMRDVVSAIKGIDGVMEVDS